jgi:xylan 1,4-beta-xylosidase
VLNTFELFSRLGRKRVAVDAPSMIPVDDIIASGVRGEPDLGVIATVNEAKSRLTILLWNYHDVAGGYDDRQDMQLTLAGLADSARGARAVEYAIDELSGNAYTAWLAMGSPQPPSAAQIEKLHAAARMHAVPRDITRNSSGQAQLQVVLPRQSVKLIELELATKPPAKR